MAIDPVRCSYPRPLQRPQAPLSEDPEEHPLNASREDPLSCGRSKLLERYSHPLDAVKRALADERIPDNRVQVEVLMAVDVRPGETGFCKARELLGQLPFGGCPFRPTPIRFDLLCRRRAMMLHRIAD